MLLRGIAFAEARRNSARRVFKSRDKTQGNGCERDAASDLAHDGSLASAHVRTTMMVYEPLLPVFPILSEGEAISLVATASKLATVEDVGPKRPEGPIRPSAASLKVSPTARATLQALRSKSKLVTSPVSTRDAETITANFADSGRRYLDEENGKAESSASAGREIMYLGTREARRPKGPAKLKEILEKREAVLSKWRDDVCSGEELPEVEIISLLEEQIPRYRLRADTLTQFQGYENADWFIPAPALKSEDVDLKLSPDQIRETLNYFILCSNRVSQMTKTYNDIEAVTRLLEEKEKDLELTARIGKELLAHNQKLETTVNALEAELKEANEKITQLSHEMLKKTELINILTNDVDESSSEAGTPTGLRGINLETLQRKVTCLEDENKQLRNEFAKLMHDTDSTEEQETRLVQDIAAQLANANLEVDGIAEELGRQKDENRLQHEQIISLTAKLAETELRLAQLMAEHDDVGATLVITRDNQNTLAAELAEFKERYAEVVNLLAETQEQLRKQRKRGMPTVRGGSLFPSMGAAPQPDSIASELESSLYSELSIDSGIGAGDRIPPYKKVFETVRSASRATYAGMDPNQFPRIGSMNTSTLSSSSVGPRMSCGQVRPQASTFPSLDSTGHSESDGSLLMETDDYPGPQRMGVPGAPGAADLEAAIRRLTPAEVLARRACLSTGAGYSYDYDGGILHSPPNFLPFDCRTPDSIMSTGSSGNLSGFSGNSGNAWRIPQKLQIVKPMEGSQTLHHWSRLATPTLGGLLEDRPGVKTRGGRALEDLGLITFALSDLEEDEEYTNPGKPFQDTGSIYTFTNSTVMHPDDHTTSSVTPSIVSSRVASAPNSGMNSGMSTPRTHSRRNSTSTFSTTLGLAKMLNERGIKAVTPSCIGTPTDERNFSPTATPCNSPDASLSPRSSSPPPESGASLTLGLLSTGAELLRRTFSYEPPAPMQVKKKRPKSTISRSDKKALTGIRLVEKIERIGIDTIIATTTSSSISPLALQGALYTRRSTGSPMAQLTFLKTSMSSSTSQEKLISPSSSASSTSDEFPSSKPPSLLGKRANSQEPQPSVSGSNAFNSRAAGQSPDRQRRSGAKATRPDLGRVKPPAPTPVTKESKQSALGAISSLLFGRKGGLL